MVPYLGFCGYATEAATDSGPQLEEITLTARRDEESPANAGSARNPSDRYTAILKSAQAGLSFADVAYGDPRTLGANARDSF